MKAEQLRKSILQLAIQGKLVPQDPNDEPASVLLERIRAEKQRLIKQGKIKKDKGDSVIFKGDDNCYYEKTGSEVKNITDEIDFELPNGWCLARVNSLFYIQTGASFKKEQATNDSTQARVLRGGNIFQGEYQFYDNDIFIDRKLVQDCIILKTNDLITPAVTSIENIGKIARVEKDYDNVTAGGFVFIIRPCYNSDVFAKYMLYALQSSYFNKQLKSITKKSGQAFYNLGKERLIQLIVPIPPIDEQCRIIKAIEKFSPLIKEYDKIEQQATKLDSEIYDKLKKSILQYAIQGKLVPQDKNDEPASELLKRIRTEKKAQLGKKYVESYIYKGDDNCYYEHINGKTVDINEEIPFDLPENWCWTRFEQAVEYTTDYVANGSFTSLKENVKVYKSANYALMIKTQDFANDFSFDLTYTDKKGYDFLSKSALYGGELMLSNIGASIGKAFIIPRLNIPMTIAPNSIVVKCFNDVTTNYLKILMLSFYGQQVLADFTAGTAMPKFSKTQLRNLFIPIPPLAEQKRIVEKVDEIFAKL